LLDLSLITVNYCNAELLISVVDKTLIEMKGWKIEIIVVDNHSSDGSFEMLYNYYSGNTIVRVISSDVNRGFGYGCNLGALQANSEVLWFINSDAWVLSAEGLSDTLALISSVTTGIVGTSVILNDGTPTPQGGSDMSFSYFLMSSFRLGKVFRMMPGWFRALIMRLLSGVSGIFGKYVRSHNHSDLCDPYISQGVGGASFFIRKELYLEMNGFDEDFFLYDEDGDICLRSIALGKKNFIDPRVKVATFPSATTSKLNPAYLRGIKRKSRLRLIRKHFSGSKRIILIIVTHSTFRLL
jgi:GT2 family glycosyltransferase